MLAFCGGSFSYTSHAFCFLAFFLSPSLMWGVSLRHPMLALFLSGDFLLHIPCWLYFYLGSFSYTSRADFIFIWGVSLTHPPKKSHTSHADFFLYTGFSVYVGSFSYRSGAGFFRWKLLGFLHVPCWLVHVGSLSYTSCAGCLM